MMPTLCAKPKVNSASCEIAPPATQLARPNVLFAIADDASHFGIYGHSFVQTPVVDTLAKEGVLFTNAFTTNPKCAPSRASILTGKHTWQLKEGCTHFSYFPKESVYPDILEEQGYHVGFTGKGWAPGDFTHYGRTENPAGSVYNTHTLTPPEGSSIKPIDYVKNFQTFLQDKPQDSPFCFWYGCLEPHRPYTFGEGDVSGTSLQDIEIPPYWPDTEDVRRDMRDYAFEINWFDTQLGGIIAELKKQRLYENTLIVVTSDNGAPFPRVKGQMYDNDFRLPLIIKPTGQLKQPLVREELVSFIDFFPTFLELAGADDEGTTTEATSHEPTSNPNYHGKSLLPLLHPNYNMHPEAFRPAIAMGRERHDLGRKHDAGYPVRCLRTHQYLYVWNIKPERWPAGNPETGFTNCDSSPTKTKILALHQEGCDHYFNLAFGKRPEEELYHIIDDPYCMHNMAHTKSGKARCSKFRTQLQTIMHHTEDPRAFGKGNEFDTHPYVGNDHHSWKALAEGRWKKQLF